MPAARIQRSAREWALARECWLGWVCWWVKGSWLAGWELALR